MLNRGAVERAIRFGLAVGAKVATQSMFARKNYFYPDLPKGYQISQYETPVVQGGTVALLRRRRAARRAPDARAPGRGRRQVAARGLRRAQPASTSTAPARRCSRSSPSPTCARAREAVGYARALHALVVWLGICDGNMQEGSFRCDANVSVRKPGAPYGTRREIKNLNSFRFLQQAIDSEVQWQIDCIEDGGRVQQATVLYDPDRGETRAMRTKEDAHDYRYFPDPDLPPLVIGAEWIERVRADMPELPGAMAERLQREHGLPAYDAAMMTQSRDFAAYFEAVVAAGAAPKPAANWLMGEVSRRLNAEGGSIAAAPVGAATLARLLGRIADATLSNSGARQVFDALWTSRGGDVDALVGELGLAQESDAGALEAIVDGVLAANPKSVEEYRAGKGKALNALVGQAMKASKGRADPARVGELLRARLAATGA